MKPFILLTIALLFCIGFTFAQEEIEKEILSLEKKEVQAILHHDYQALEGIWASDFMVNNPYNMVLKGRSFVFDRMKEGVINYHSFEREVEGISILENTVIVMGREVIVPKEGAPMAGQKVPRRYTNIWVSENGHWMLKARHASLICQ